MGCIVWGDSLPSGRCHTWFSACSAEQKEQWNASLHPSIDFKWLKKGWSLQVEELKKQSTANSSLLPGISSVTMEASMIMSNIQRIIQVSMASLDSLLQELGLTVLSLMRANVQSPMDSGFAWPEWGWDLKLFLSLFPPPKSSSQHFGVWVFSESELWVFNRPWQKVHVGEVQLLKPLWI